MNHENFYYFFTVKYYKKFNQQPLIEIDFQALDKLYTSFSLSLLLTLIHLPSFISFISFVYKSILSLFQCHPSSFFFLSVFL